MIRETLLPWFAASLLVIALADGATAASVPHTFTPGTVASASEVNANFAALVEAVSALEAKVDPQTAEALAGTYDYFEVKIDVDDLSSSSKSIAGAGTSGTVVLNADGSGHASLSGSYRQLALSGVDNAGDETVDLNFASIPETVDDDITWSLSNGIVTIDGAGSFAVVGRLLIESVIDSEGQNGIVILARR
jgi:hypothetical protein